MDYDVEREAAKGCGLIDNAMKMVVVVRIEASSQIRRFIDM